MRRLILDSLRYWVEEMHVDGFRFDLAPILGEKDGQHYIWEDPKNTVLQEIIDDPVIKANNVRIISEPWAAGGYDLGQSYNGPGNNDLSNGYGTRIGLFPAETERPGVGWYEWNARFRDWWRAYLNAHARTPSASGKLRRSSPREEPHPCPRTPTRAGPPRRSPARSSWLSPAATSPPTRCSPTPG
jgi:pullulanase/glycogen debranching enzyme